ncbi:LysE family translocator [Pseudomonas sp. S5(2021)]|nr:LysE family translocator [Stutzerimonas balearica]KIL03598.1 lysine transporter LysE [Stutzerimonas stutzeri]MBZ5754475.1 LysE family translocator [Pseudomonas sp. S5(2021)]WIX04917.1 LysE family translocator [Pseudomonas sp. AR5]MBC7200543.1 LysE family translocator [Stutzerimonas balearica]MBD3738437.1 LysE family translocator [Stutzerimonas balearica]
MMSLFLLVAGTHFAALLSPGPDFFLLIRTALRHGRRQADGCACGIALANLASMLLVLGALALLPEAGSTFTRLLQLLGGGYFLWLGATAVLARRELSLPEGDAQASGRALAGLLQGLLASSLNPKLPLFYAGLFGVLRDAATPAWGLALAMLWMGAVVLLWDLALVRLLYRPRWRNGLRRRVRTLDRLCGALLALLGSALLGGALAP